MAGCVSCSVEGLDSAVVIHCVECYNGLCDVHVFECRKCNNPMCIDCWRKLGKDLCSICAREE